MIHKKYINYGVMTVIVMVRSVDDHDHDYDDVCSSCNDNCVFLLHSSFK